MEAAVTNSSGCYSTNGHLSRKHATSCTSTGGSAQSGWASDGSRPAPLGSNQLRSMPYPSPGNGPLQQAWIARFTQSLRMLLLEIEDSVVHIDEQGLNLSNERRSNYAIMGRLGSGAYGHVYKAMHLPTMRIVAIKKISIKDISDFDHINSFAREVVNLYGNLRRLEERGSTTTANTTTQPNEENKGSYCPYLLTFYDAFLEREPDNFCLVVEYMDGGSLQDMIDMVGGCKDEATLKKICYNVLMALKYLHNDGTLHQDIKPGNILINREKFAKIADFGLAAVDSSDPITLKHEVGTIRYWPPEMWGSEKTRNKQGKGDIWSFGLSVLALACGREPFESCKANHKLEVLFSELWSKAHEAHPPNLAQLVVESNQLGFEALESPSSDFLNFLSCCLTDEKQRWSATDLLNHPFLRDYEVEAGRLVNLHEACKALKSHLHKHCGEPDQSWKLTPTMVTLLARELQLDDRTVSHHLRKELDPSCFDDTKAPLSIRDALHSGRTPLTSRPPWPSFLNLASNSHDVSASRGNRLANLESLLQRLQARMSGTEEGMDMLANASLSQQRDINAIMSEIEALRKVEMDDQSATNLQSPPRNYNSDVQLDCLVEDPDPEWRLQAVNRKSPLKKHATGAGEEEQLPLRGGHTEGVDYAVNFETPR